MFKTVEEGIEKYKNESREYMEWLKALGEKLKTPISEIIPYLRFTHDELKKAEKWTAKLNGMQEALGLTEEEDKEIQDAIKRDLNIPD